jgi:hypothetical protein
VVAGRSGEEVVPRLLALAGTRAEYSSQRPTPYGTSRFGTSGFRVRVRVRPGDDGSVRISMMAEDAWIEGDYPKAFRTQVVRRIKAGQPLKLILNEGEEDLIHSRIELTVTEADE